MALSFSRLLFSYSVHRAAIAGLSFGASIIGARILPAEDFAMLVTAAFLAKFLHILNFGATAGYFVSRYSAKGPLAQDDPIAERRFLIYYLAQMGGLGLIILGLAATWLPEYRMGAIIFLLLSPLYVVEPSLRYHRNFSFSLSPEFILAVSLVSVFTSFLLGVADGLLMVIYVGSIALLAASLLLLAMGHRTAELRGGRTTFERRDYANLLALGGPVYLGTALFLLASSMDRLILPLHGSDEQVAMYFLAQQLAVGSMIFVTAINFVNTINLGEACQEKSVVDKDMVLGKIRSAALVALGSYGALIVGVYVLERSFLPESFDGQTRLVAILGAGLAAFYTSNAITPIVAYYHRQMPLTVAMGVVALVLLGNNAVNYWYGLGTNWLAAGTSLALGTNAVFAIWYTFAVLRDQSAVLSVKDN